MEIIYAAGNTAFNAAPAVSLYRKAGNLCLSVDLSAVKTAFRVLSNARFPIYDE